MATKKDEKPAPAGKPNRKTLVEVYDHQRDVSNSMPYGSYLDLLANEVMSQKGTGKKIMRYTLGKSVKPAPKKVGAAEE